MGKPKKIHRQPRFQYDRNRSREWRKSKKLPPIECEQIKQAWNSKKSVQQNLRSMGLSMDPNVTLKIPSTKELLLGEGNKQKKKKKNVQKGSVIAELEKEASTSQAKTLQLSEPEVRYCVYMIEKYGEDYKAMSRDRGNYYQDTPKQIKRKINSFKNTPSQYATYQKLKDVIGPKDNESTPEKVIVDMTANTRKVTRKYIARRRNGHYTSPVVSMKRDMCANEVPIHKVKRKLNFGRKPPTPRETESDLQKKEESPKRTNSTQCGKKEMKKHKKLSKELLDLLDVSDHFIYSEKLRSKSKVYVGGHIEHGSNKLHPSPETISLVQERQN